MLRVTVSLKVRIWCVSVFESLFSAPVVLEWARVAVTVVAVTTLTILLPHRHYFPQEPRALAAMVRNVSLVFDCSFRRP